MATKSIVRTLLWRVGIVGACFVALFAVLNFVYAPSCGRFGCSYVPSWWPQAAADSGGCPDAISGAMNDAGWAADRYAEIADEHLTTGLFFDEDGEKHTFDSRDEKGDDAERARKTLQAVGAAPAANGSYPAATHVEVKVAALMRETGVKTGVLVINNKTGPCIGDQGLSCQEVLKLILPAGTRLRVWFPDPDSAKPMRQMDFP